MVAAQLVLASILLALGVLGWVLPLNSSTRRLRDLLRESPVGDSITHVLESRRALLAFMVVGFALLTSAVLTERAMPPARQELDPNAQTVATNEQIGILVRNLKLYTPPRAPVVEVAFATAQQQPVAAQINDALVLAGWASKVVDTPIEQWTNEKALAPHAGVDVVGNPKVLVEAVAKLLTDAGYKRVMSTFQDTGMAPRSLNIYVGP